jgi:hypothetical protein
MAWRIFYKHRDVVCFCAIGLFEHAMNEACALLDRGENVIKVTSGNGMTTIGADEIRLIHAARKKTLDEEGNRMTSYRCYFMDMKHHIWDVEDLTDCSDVEAQTTAVRLLALRVQYHAVEVWDKARIVSRHLRALA